MIKIPPEVKAAVKGYLKAAFGGRYVLTDEEWKTCARAANERLAKAQEKILADRVGGTHDR